MEDLKMEYIAVVHAGACRMVAKGMTVEAAVKKSTLAYEEIADHILALSKESKTGF